jgi:hypothetical protein
MPKHKNRNFYRSFFELLDGSGQRCAIFRHMSVLFPNFTQNIPMINKCFLINLFILCFATSGLYAQKKTSDTSKIKKILPPIEKFYIGNSFDGAIFSTAFIQRTAMVTNPNGTTSTVTNNSLGTLRFTYFINFGLTFNYNFARHFGAYTGIDIKNIGFIEQDASANIVKRRTYNVGIPVGIKIGNMAWKKSYLFLGAGIDAPINYKEKSFVIRSNKTKYNEWFSDATPQIMPYVFAGAVINRGLSFKVQYYPNNFLNPEYTRKGIKPFAGTDVQLLAFSVGIAARYGKHHDIVKKQITELNTM